MPETDTGAPPRTLIIVAAVLAVALAAGVAIFGIIAGNSGSENADDDAVVGPLPLVSVPAPRANAPECADLLAAAPGELTSNGKQLPRRELAAPAPPAAAAWGRDNPVVLRCGLDRPAELTPTAQLRVVNGVQWLEVPGEGTATWYAVDRPVFVALTIPGDAGTGPLQDLSTLIGSKLKPQPLKF